MQIVKKYLFLVLVFVALLIPVTAEASTENVYICDDADILSDADEQAIQDYLSDLDDEYDYVVVTSNSGSYGSTAEATLEYYYDDRINAADDGMAMIIDMYNREIYFSGYGKAEKSLKNSDLVDITDNVYRYASKENYRDCFIKGFEQADRIVNNHFVFRPMRVIVSCLLAIVLGFLLCFMKAVSERSKITADTTVNKFIVLGAAVSASAVVYDTRRVKRQSSSSNYHSGGHSSHSSGHSHHSSGGSHRSHSGGGHRF